ncbi:MAG: hypothetical protein ACTHJS_12590 [Xanthobacteraceae bacterium]
MNWTESSPLIAEAELRLAEGEKRIRKQRAIVARLERAGADTEQARKLLSHLIDAQQGQKLQLGRLRSGVRGKRRLGNLGGDDLC